MRRDLDKECMQCYNSDRLQSASRPQEQAEIAMSNRGAIRLTPITTVTSSQRTGRRLSGRALAAPTPTMHVLGQRVGRRLVQEAHVHAAVGAHVEKDVTAAVEKASRRESRPGHRVLVTHCKSARREKLISSSDITRRHLRPRAHYTPTRAHAPVCPDTRSRGRRPRQGPVSTYGCVAVQAVRPRSATRAQTAVASAALRDAGRRTRPLQCTGRTHPLPSSRQW